MCKLSAPCYRSVYSSSRFQYTSGRRADTGGCRSRVGLTLAAKKFRPPLCWEACPCPCQQKGAIDESICPPFVDQCANLPLIHLSSWNFVVQPPVKQKFQVLQLLCYCQSTEIFCRIAALAPDLPASLPRYLCYRRANRSADSDGSLARIVQKMTHNCFHPGDSMFSKG